MKKIKIGNSDYNRKQIESGVYGWGTTNKVFLQTIKEYEDDGYIVKFETSIWRKLFCVGIYNVVAIKYYEI